MAYKSFQEMPIWQRGHHFLLRIYEVTSKFPRGELFNLTAQLRRSAISITNGIAEAFGRYHYLDKVNFYLDSRGSLEEAKNCLIVSRDLGYISKREYEQLWAEAEKIAQELNPLIKVLRGKGSKQKQKSRPESQISPRSGS